MKSIIFIGLIVLLLLATGGQAANFRFAGEDFDGQTNTVYLRARYYDPNTGQFLNKDPLGVSGGINSYLYGNADPVNESDPLGQVSYGPDGLPILEISADRYPDLAANIYNAQMAGFPSVLTYTGDPAATAANREAALLGVPNVYPDILSRDEYPFASTLEGGAGSFIGNIPISQNSAQGGLLSNFYRNLNPGDQFRVNVSGLGFDEEEGDDGLGGVTSDPLDLGGGPSFGGSVSSGIFSGLSSADSYSSLFGNVSSEFGLSNSLDVGGVLIDKAATLVSSTLNNITGATYDPVSQQIVYLGTTGTNATTPINMDYFYTAIQAVYGSAVPPSVTLDPPALAVTPWTDYGNGNGVWDNAETNGFVLQYDPIWNQVGETVDVRVRATSGINGTGTQYDFTYHFVAQTATAILGPNGYPYTKLVLTGSTNVPAGIYLDPTPFEADNIAEEALYTNDPGKLENWYVPINFTNNTGAALYGAADIVIPGYQHRAFGGRVDGTKMGWVMYEADRVMKCLGVGKDNLTGATYSSATINVSGYQNLLERSLATNDKGGNMRMWFEPNQMTLQRYVDPNTGQATINFQTSTVTLLTESYLQGLAADPVAASFVAQFQQNYDAFTALSFPVHDPTDPTSTRIINAPIFAMLKQVMQAVSLARFFHDNNIPLDTWWLNSWQPPTAYIPQVAPTVVNSGSNGTTWVLLNGGVTIQKPNGYLPSNNAQSVGTAVTTQRPFDPANPSGDIQLQSWTASSSGSNYQAVSTSMATDVQTGNIKLAHRDLSFASPGELPLDFTRYYDSSWVGTTGFGPGWRQTRYVLQFSNPSWYDQTHVMKDSGGSVLTTDTNGDTRLRSGTVRLVDLKTGKMLDFQSSTSLAYSIDGLGNPYVSVAGLGAGDVPTFAGGTHQNGTTLLQSGTGGKSYYATLPDFSVLQFDSNGNLLQTTDRHHYNHYYQYSSPGQLSTITDDANQTITLTSSNGLVQTATGPNNEGVTYHYDGSNRLVAVVHNRSNAVIAQYNYNSENQLGNVTTADGLTPVATTPDTKGRSASRKDKRGNSTSWAFYKNAATGAHTAMVSDTNSGLSSWQQGTDASGRTTYVMNPMNYTTQYGYTGGSLYPNTIQLPTPNRPAISIARNSAGMPTTITDPAVQGALPSSITYWNSTTLPMHVTDAANRATDLSYTASNNLQKITRYHNGQAVNTNLVYTNEFLTSGTDPLGNTWKYGRDSLGRLTANVDPTLVTTGSYDYDSYGRLWHVYDPRMTKPVTLGYDNMNNMTSVATASGTTIYTYATPVTWVGGTAVSGSGSRLMGMTTTGTDGLVRTVSYTYNSQTGDLTGETHPLVNSSGTSYLTTGYGYTPYGYLQSVTPPGAQPINFTVNALGQTGTTSETDAGMSSGPVVLVASDASSGIWTNVNTQTFTWGAPISSVPVTGYNYAKNGSTSNTVNTTTPSISWSGAPEGQNTFRVRGKDSAGNWSPDSLFNLWVDTVAPVISGASVSAFVQGSAVTLKGTVTDATSGVSGTPQFEWRIGTGAWSGYANMTAGSGSQWTASVSQNWSSYSGQTFYYQIQAQDVAGNVQTGSYSAAINLSTGVETLPEVKAWTGRKQ